MDKILNFHLKVTYSFQLINLENFIFLLGITVNLST